MSEEKEPAPKRHYPPVYEKIIPVAIGAIVVAIVVLLIIIAVVLAGVQW